MAGATTVTVTVDNTREASRQVEQASYALAESWARRVATRASNLTKRVRTGAMKGGFRVYHSGRGIEFIIQNTQFYQTFHEMGTRFMSAEPTLYPSMKWAIPLFQGALKKMLGWSWRDG